MKNSKIMGDNWLKNVKEGLIFYLFCPKETAMATPKKDAKEQVSSYINSLPTWHKISITGSAKLFWPLICLLWKTGNGGLITTAMEWCVAMVLS
jgi:hypothetical protein